DDYSAISLTDICFQVCTSFITHNSFLQKLAGNGRKALVDNLTADEAQVFRNAGLLSEMPEFRVIQWWDHLKSLKRNLIDEAKNLQGRTAELWTIEHETIQCKQFGEGYKPQWVSLESDKYGYDIQSFRQKGSGTCQAILIEVKSFAKKIMPRIFITRKEWVTALESYPSYIFIVWCVETVEFREYSVDDFLIDVPIDTGAGKWQNIEITLKW
ncbi:MAG: DUF3883 domain-containing protein, partial [Chitinophagaceae bacterium]